MSPKPPDSTSSTTNATCVTPAPLPRLFLRRQTTRVQNLETSTYIAGQQDAAAGAQAKKRAGTQLQSKAPSQRGLPAWNARV